MVLFTITNLTLDATMGITWWVIKNTIYGTYYLGSYFLCPPPEENHENHEILELKYQITQLNRNLARINSVCEILHKSQSDRMLAETSYSENVTETLDSKNVIKPTFEMGDDPVHETHSSEITDHHACEVDDAFILINEPGLLKQ